MCIRDSLWILLELPISPEAQFQVTECFGGLQQFGRRSWRHLLHPLYPFTFLKAGI